MIGNPHSEVDILSRLQNVLSGIEFNSFRINTNNYIVAQMIRKQLQDKSNVEESQDPDIVINYFDGDLFIEIQPIYIYGRYRKMRRDMPQTKWPCHSCGGHGCARCNYTGKIYSHSVEDIYGNYLLPLFKGRSTSFHGLGREDRDALMLGSGRPFVIEIKKPHVRSIPEEKLYYRDDNIEVICPHYTTRDKIKYVKQSAFFKRYRAEFRCETPVLSSSIGERFPLGPVIVHQRTPLRVLHRRSDKVRDRMLMDGYIMMLDENRGILEIIVESGFYVKEFISGDGGRTWPSLSTIVGRPCECRALDVLTVFDDDLFLRLIEGFPQESDEGFQFVDISGMRITEDADVTPLLSSLAPGVAREVMSMKEKRCDRRCSECKIWELCLKRDKT